MSEVLKLLNDAAYKKDGFSQRNIRRIAAQEIKRLTAELAERKEFYAADFAKLGMKTAEVFQLRNQVETLTAENTRKEMEIKRLFMLLDDIDSAGDMFKPEKTPYFGYVELKHRERFNGITSTDGYEITVSTQREPLGDLCKHHHEQPGPTIKDDSTGHRTRPGIGEPEPQ